MLCDVCGKKKATVHLTEIVDEQMSEMHLCEECAHAKSVQMEQQFGLGDLLAGLSDFGKQIKEQQQVKMQCPNCGLNYEDFKKVGRLGCSECYTAYHDQLAILLKKIHGSGQHLGKSPEVTPKVFREKSEILQDMKDKLQQAVQDEDFEKAAYLRDKIRELEKET